MIHAFTHRAAHSLCSCAGHMRNMISQHLPCPWKFLFFTQPSHPLPSCQCWRCYPDREAGARLSHPCLPQIALCFTQARPASASCVYYTVGLAVMLLSLRSSLVPRHQQSGAESVTQHFFQQDFRFFLGFRSVSVSLYSITLSFGGFDPPHVQHSLWDPTQDDVCVCVGDMIHLTASPLAPALHEQHTAVYNNSTSSQLKTTDAVAFGRRTDAAFSYKSNTIRWFSCEDLVAVLLSLHGNVHHHHSD